jgi:hypothetical protein
VARKEDEEMAFAFIAVWACVVFYLAAELKLLMEKGL